MRYVVSSSAPGRVDLFNTHQDYKGLPVVPAAVNLRTVTEGSPGGWPLKVKSINMGEEVEVRPDDEVDVNRWEGYVIAALKALKRHGYNIGGGSIVVRSNVPIASGLASSAALLVSVINWFNKAYGLGLGKRELAELAYEAEHDIMGIPCGRLDQYSSAYGGLIVLEPKPPYNVEELGLKKLDFIVVDSGVRHRTLNVHSVRQRELREALNMLKEAMPKEYWPMLDAPLDQVDWVKLSNLAKPYLETLDNLHRKRLEFTFKMNESTMEAIAELRKDNPDKVKLGRIMNIQHELLRDLYEVSIPELEEIKRTLDEAGALGAKISGAGLGGSIVALVKDAEEARQIVDRHIKDRWSSWIVSIDVGAY